MLLKDVKVLINAEEDDDLSSWVKAKPYRDVLEEARKDCPEGYRILTLFDYLKLWMDTVKSQGSRACNEADFWMKFEDDRNLDHPVSHVRHPFKSTVLVDTYLTDFSYSNGKYYATLIEGGVPKGKLDIPRTGKIYDIDKYGIPSWTGGEKRKESYSFEHRWWAFSSDEIRTDEGQINSEFSMALFGNGGTIGCFCELIKAHYSIDDAGGFYRVLAIKKE